jgi:hypothetical protein
MTIRDKQNNMKVKINKITNDGTTTKIPGVIT